MRCTRSYQKKKKKNPVNFAPDGPLPSSECSQKQISPCANGPSMTLPPNSASTSFAFAMAPIPSASAPAPPPVTR